MICSETGSPFAIPFGTASAHRSSRLANLVKCAGVFDWSTASSAIAVVGVVGVSSASNPAKAAANARLRASRSVSAVRYARAVTNIAYQEFVLRSLRSGQVLA